MIRKSKTVLYTNYVGVSARKFIDRRPFFLYTGFVDEKRVALMALVFFLRTR